MSSISSRPRVQQITGPILTALSAHGVVLAGSVFKALAGAATTIAGGMKLTPALPVQQELHPVEALRGEFHRNRQGALHQATLGLPEVDALRAAAFAGFAKTPFYIASPETLQSHCLALQSAATASAVQKAERALLEVLAVGHQQVFANTLALACERAVKRLGFDRIEVVRLPKEVRVIASDPGGRTLVSEIHPNSQGGPAMATEVVSVSDGCQQLLDEFDRALEAEGVRSAPPDRKFTGGVCELAAARAIARERWKPLEKTKAGPGNNKSVGIARTRRANEAQTVIKQSKG